jgi:hypothetical protein
MCLKHFNSGFELAALIQSDSRTWNAHKNYLSLQPIFTLAKKQARSQNFIAHLRFT